ncbi:probable proton-coupled zinc antiporter SLC30A3 isoform X2 [Cuculus canorus]|uniref:probable proton-coupled zinc antiporter SLC30A3 isoform X2 n=1 Tax=Cuculus canorus TaxID=55661 RepID=UPI0023AAB40C|nr:probable proton-coupled zinc antiporter SLC30A3 isoform X2 [Cuculus canorus]
MGLIETSVGYPGGGVRGGESVPVPVSAGCRCPLPLAPRWSPRPAPRAPASSARGAAPPAAACASTGTAGTASRLLRHRHLHHQHPQHRHLCHRLFVGPRDALVPPSPPGPRCHCSPLAPSPGPGGLRAHRQLSIACAVCCTFMVGEVIGGYLAHSLAIMTDAAHLLTDVGSMAVSLFSLRVSTHAPTKTMSFGWHRSETLGALASVLSIWVVTGALVYLAAARIISNDYEIEARAMLATSAGAVGVNLVMAHILHQTPTGCGVGGPRSRDCRLPPAQPGSASVRAAFVHVVGDLLQSLGVLTAAAIIYAKPQYKIADPISTLFFSVFVLGSTITILRDVLRVLMEGAPRGLEFDTVKATLLGVSGVQSTHDLHLWALTLGQPALSAHVAIDAGADPELVLRDATAQLRARFGVTCCTLQVERYQEEMGGCPHCRDPCA